MPLTALDPKPSPGAWLPRRFLTLLLGALLGMVALAAALQPAEASPFDGAASPPSSSRAVEVHGSPIGQFVQHVQREASWRLTEATARLKHHAFGPSIAIAFLLAFLYGCIHAAGPGHGKTVVAGYFLARDAKLVRGLWLSTTSALAHVASSLVVVGVLAFVLQQTLPSIEDERAVRLVSYGAVVALGLVLLAQTASRDRDAGACAHGGCDDHDHPDERDKTTRILAVAAGLVPCTGSLMVLTYTVANGLAAIGVGLVVAIGAGMALTTTLFGLAARVARRGLLARTPSSDRGSLILARALSFVGPLLVVVTGGTLFTLTWVLT